MADPQQVTPTLELISPILAGELYELNKDLVRIGRDPDSDISLTQGCVVASCLDFPEAGRVFLEDRERRNKTFLDGVKLESEGPFEAQ